MFDWDDVRHFVALAEAGTLSGAARALRVDHATVARRVAALERALDETLVDRLAKRWCLTEAGRDVARTAAGMLDQAHALQRAVRARQSGSPTVVTVSAPPAFASHFLAPLSADLAARHPDVEWTLLGSQGMASLGRREADVAVRLWNPTEAGSVTRRIGRVLYGLYAAPTYASTPTPDWRFIAYEASLDHVPEQQWLRAVADGRRIVFRTNDLMSQLAAARSGLGVAALPRFLGDADAAVVRLPSATAPVARDVQLVVHADLRRRPAVRAVLDYIAEKVAAGLPRDDAPAASRPHSRRPSVDEGR